MDLWSAVEPGGRTCGSGIGLSSFFLQKTAALCGVLYIWWCCGATFWAHQPLDTFTG